MSNVVEIIITGKDKFTEVSAKTREEVNKLGAEAEGMGAKAAGALDIAAKASIALGGAALAGIGKAVEEYASYGEQVLKIQRTTGMAAEDSSKLIFAAKETGVSYEGLSRSLMLFSKNMLAVKEQDEGFTKNLTSNQKVLHSLGIDALDAAGNIRPLPELLEQLADKFHSMPDGAEKTGLAMQLFGRAGAQLLPFLNQGAEGIKELNAEAEKLGLVLSQKDVDAAHQFTLAQRQMEEALKGVEISVAQKVVPGLSQLANAFKEGMASGDAFEKLMKGIAFGLAALWADAMALIANQVESVFERIVKAGATALNWLIDKANTVSNLVPIIGGDITDHVNADDFHMTRTDMVDPLQGLKKLFPDITKTVKDFGQTVGDTTPQLDALGTTAKDTRTKMDLVKEGLDLLHSAASDLFSRPTVERASANLNTDKLQYKLDQLTDHFAPAINKLADFKQSVSDAKDKLSDWSDDISRRKDIVSDAQQAVRDRADSLKQYQGDLNDANDPGSRQRKAIDLQLNTYDRQMKGMDLANRALEKEDKQRAKQEKTLEQADKNADKQKALIDKQVQGVQRQVDSQTRLAKMDDDKNKIMQDELTLADKTLLTSKERDALYQQLLTDTKTVSARIRDSGTALKDGLIPSITKVHEIAMSSGDVLEAIRRVTEKQDKAAASADRLSTALDGAATKMATIPGSILAAVTGSRSWTDFTHGGVLKGGGKQSIKPPNVGEAGLASRRLGIAW